VDGEIKLVRDVDTRSLDRRVPDCNGLRRRRWWWRRRSGRRRRRALRGPSVAFPARGTTLNCGGREQSSNDQVAHVFLRSPFPETITSEPNVRGRGPIDYHDVPNDQAPNAYRFSAPTNGPKPKRACFRSTANNLESKRRSPDLPGEPRRSARAVAARQRLRVRQREKAVRRRRSQRRLRDAIDH